MCLTATNQLTLLPFHLPNVCLLSTFVTHDCDGHAGLLQHPQTFSLATVLQVTEVEAGHEDPKAKVGHLTEELGQCEGAVGAGRPGAKPGDGVTEPPLSCTAITPQSGAQGSQVAQEQQLQRNTNTACR